VGDLPAGKARDASLRHEEAVELVVRSTLTVNDAGEECPMLTMDEARNLDAETLHDLCGLVASEQDAAHGAMCVDADVIAAVEKDRSLNRARALHAVGLAAYYGGAARDLTDWQVVIYLHLIRKDD
jgi:hypothetical protein